MICPRTSIGNGWPLSISGSRRPCAASRAVYNTPVMLTRSPAVSASTSASLSGGATSLTPSARTVTLTGPSSLQQRFLVPVRVALDRDGDGQRGDVTGIGEDMDAERRGVAAVALGPDAEAVRAVQHVALERDERRIGVRAAQLAEQRLLGQDRGLLERAADADARDQRRARVGPGRLDALEDPRGDALDAFPRSQHLVFRPVLAAATLGHDLDAQRGARHEIQVDDGRRVVARVHAVEWGLHDRRAQIALRVTLPHALVDRVRKEPA